MALISVEEAKPGLVIEKNVTNAHGQLLVAAGISLTERHLTLLRSWGVLQISVLITGETAKEMSESQQTNNVLLEKAEASLREAFSLALSDDPIMQEIHRQCVQRKAKLLPLS